MAGKFYRILVALIVVIIGIFWITEASAIGAPGFFILFGIVFVGIALYILLKTLFSK